MEITFEQLPKAVIQLYKKLENIERLLITIKKESSIEVDQLLTVQKAAEMVSLSVPTIYGLVQRAEIPVCKRGKRLYFSKQELIIWIKAGRKKTIAETACEADKYLSSKEN